MADIRQRSILKVLALYLLLWVDPLILPQVFRKYGHSLGPESLGFLEEILDHHEIPMEDVESSVEWMAKEYNKQDGWNSLFPRLRMRSNIFRRCSDEGFTGCSQEGL